MSNVRVLVLIALAAGLFGAAGAQNLDMRNTDPSQRFDAPGKPTRGMTQSRVEAEFGEPTPRRAPVGEPPITRWDYPGFAVFFEYDKVIHAVAK